MLTKTKFALAGIATVLLLGSAYAAAQAPEVDDADAAPMTEGLDGRHVTFGYDAATGTITDYARVVDDGSLTIFESIAFGSYNASDAKAKQHGRVLMAKDGDLLRAAFFDARNAAFVMSSPAGNVVTLTVADGIGVQYHAAEENWSPEGVLLTYGNHTARLVVRGDADVQVDGQNVTVTLGPHAGLAFKVDGHKLEELKERVFLAKLHKHLKDKKHEAKGRGEEMRELKAKGRGAK